MGSETTQGMRGTCSHVEAPQNNTSPTTSRSQQRCSGGVLKLLLFGEQERYPLVVPTQWKGDDNPSSPTCRCSPSRRAPASPSQDGSWLMDVPPRASGCASHRWQGHSGRWPHGAARVVHRTRRRLPLTPLLWPRSLLLRRGPAVRGGRANRAREAVNNQPRSIPATSRAGSPAPPRPPRSPRPPRESGCASHHCGCITRNFRRAQPRSETRAPNKEGGREVGWGLSVFPHSCFPEGFGCWGCESPGH